MSRRAFAGIATALMAAGMIIVPTQVAQAACPTRTYVSITSVQGYHMWDGVTYFKDGPGGTITAHVDRSRTISATISAGASISVSTLVTEVKAEVTASATRSLTTTIGHQYSHGVSAGKYGNLKYGSWGKRVTWKRFYDTPQCTTKVLDQGTGRVPTVAVGWRFWQTTS